MKKFLAAVAAIIAVFGFGINTVNWNAPQGDTVNWNNANIPAQATVNWNGPAPDTVNWN